MSKNKKGIQIFESADRLVIIAKDDFSENASSITEILHKLQLDTFKRVRIHLSSKTKSFQDAFFKIRKAVIEEQLEDVKILINSRPYFKQTFDWNEIGKRIIQTPSYFLTNSSGSICLNTTHKDKFFAYDATAKEIAEIIKNDKPSSVEVHFTKSEKEKEEDFPKRVTDLENFFIQCACHISSVSKMDFYVKGRYEPLLIGSYNKGTDNGNLHPFPVRSHHKAHIPTNIEHIYE